MKIKLKNKLNKIIVSATLAVALIIGAISGLLLPLSKIGSAFAEYKPTDVKSYDFNNSSNTGWVSDRTNDQNLISKFNGSAASAKQADFSTFASKPEKSYDNTTDFTDSDAVMAFKAVEAPLKTEVSSYKKDDDGNFVYEKDGDNIKEYESVPANESEDAYVKIEDNKYYKKVVEVETVNTYFGYKTSASVSLTKNSWYVVSAYVWTKDASVSLYAKNDKNFKAAYEFATSEETWKQIFLFIETSSEEDASVYLYIYYGSANGLTADVNTTAATSTSGFAYIDNVQIQKISETEYNNKTVDDTTVAAANAETYSARYGTKTLYNFQAGIESYNIMFKQDEFNSATANARFQNYVNQYTDDELDTKLTKQQLSYVYDAYLSKLTYSTVSEKQEFKTVDGETETLGKDTFQSDNKILKIANTSDKYTLGVLTPTINEIKQFGFYKLTVYVKSLDENATATVKLLSYIKDGSSIGLSDIEDGKLQVKTQTVTGFTNSDDFTNGWMEINFYIQANAYHDSSSYQGNPLVTPNVTFQIALLANANSTVYFDNIKIEEITSSVYSNAASAKKFDMSPASLLASSNITNGYFDFIKTENTDDHAPYTPATWTALSTNDKGVTAGIVSTKDNKYTTEVKASLGGAENPLAGTDSHGINYPRTNVLAIYAPNDVATTTYTYGYKSDKLALTANSVNIVTFEAFASNTAAAVFTGKIVAKITYSDSTVSSFEETITTGVWKKYTFVVRTGSSARDCYLELGIENAQGTIFFQKVGYKNLSSKMVNGKAVAVADSETYDPLMTEYGSISKQNQNKIRFVDFGNDATVIHSNEKADGKDYYTANGYNIAEVADDKTAGVIGIIDTTADITLGDEITLYKDFIKNSNSSNDVALLIYNSENAASNVSSKYTSTLSSSSYYEISFYAKTAKLANGKYLKVAMDKIDVNFAEINTGALNNTANEYVKYTAYVKTGSSSVSDLTINYILGTEDDEIVGLALISDVNITKFASASDYEAAIENVDIDDKTTIVKDLTEEKNNNSSSSKSSDDTVASMTLATFFLILSSLLLAVALIVAMVAIFVKRLPKTQKVTGTNKVNLKKKKKATTRDTSKDGFV